MYCKRYIRGCGINDTTRGSNRGSNSMRPIFCRSGNKYYLANKILPNIPDHDIYVEPFVGTGTIFFKKEKARVNVLNDLDEEIIDMYKLIKTVGNDFETDLNTIPKLQAFYNKEPKTDEDILTKYILNCNKFSGNIKGKKIYKGTNPYNKLQKIDEYKEKLKGVKLYNTDWFEVAKKYDSPNTFFFLDPPYELRESGFEAYEHDNFDHVLFKEQVEKLKGMVIITLNDSPRMRRLFRGYNIKSYEKPHHTKGIGGKLTHELVITNY